MLFNSLDYALFFTLIFASYWSLQSRGIRAQNILLLLASYFFYGCWDWRFLFLLMFSTGLDYFTGIRIHEAKSAALKKTWLIISVGINLGFLGFFKYFNFFIASAKRLLGTVGAEAEFSTLDIILPVGISFYTFHGLSYVFDIYRGKIEPTKNVVDYCLFVSFFPLLVAGPIERATHLLPQIKAKRNFDYTKAVDGLRQILWGLFKKIVVADTCAEAVNVIFKASPQLEGSTLALGAILFAIQIYGDFSGYSDIALGSARLLGFELLQNFSFPYFSRDIAEFWRKWHISLTSWFRDYLYVPLGGSKVGTLRRIYNTIIVFLVSGFWHGANWTFIAWGLYNAICFIPLLVTDKNRVNMGIVAQGRAFPGFKELLQMLATFLLVCLGWIFFRANSMGQAVQYIGSIFTMKLFSMPDDRYFSYVLFILIPLMLLIEWNGRHGKYALENLQLRFKTPFRLVFYVLIAISIILFSGVEEEFIYFQF